MRLPPMSCPRGCVKLERHAIQCEDVKLPSCCRALVAPTSIIANA
jgi:hypothetical protein